mgnify:CR=1 FL=1
MVRQVLAELDQWDVQARFILTVHTNSRGKNVKLGKDFKEILSNVSTKNISPNLHTKIDLDRRQPKSAPICQKFRRLLWKLLRTCKLMGEQTRSPWPKLVSVGPNPAQVIIYQHLRPQLTLFRRWVYLEPIFGSGTLIQEKSRFDKIDKDFHHVLIFIEKHPRVSSLCRYPNLSAILKNLQDQLNRCQKSLDNFLMVVNRQALRTNWFFFF